MRSVFKKQFVLVLPLVLFSLNPGCAHVRSPFSQFSKAPQGEIFLSPTPNYGDPNFYTRWSGATSESDKIRYLLDRVAQSEDLFIRNDAIHRGITTRQWLLYKMNRWTNKETKTADEFIQNVASHSNSTGKPYLVKFSDGRLYSLASILTNELISFEHFLNNASKVTQGTATQIASPLQAQSVSSSPTHSR